MGIYAIPTHRKALASRQPEELAKLVAVTSSQWKTDIRTLAVGIHHPLFSPNWTNMVRMLAANRADITLAPFQQTTDMSITVGDVRLVPIPGVKVAMSGSRHWPVSRKHPKACAFTKRWKKAWPYWKSAAASARPTAIVVFSTPLSPSGNW